MDDEDERIREVAYRIWEEAGRPIGQEDRHWEQAQEIVRAENAKLIRTAIDIGGPEKKPETKKKPPA